MYDANVAVFNAIHDKQEVYGLSMSHGRMVVGVCGFYGWIMSIDEMQFNPAKLNRDNIWTFSTACLGKKDHRLTLTGKRVGLFDYVELVFEARDGRKAHVDYRYLSEIMGDDDDATRFDFYQESENKPIYVCYRNANGTLKPIGVVMPLQSLNTPLPDNVWAVKRTQYYLNDLDDLL